MTILMMVAALAAAASPQASVPDDAKLAEQATVLGQCFVDKTTGADRIAVARWMLGPKHLPPAGFDPVERPALRRAQHLGHVRALAFEPRHEG
ncbi:hypothetical protein, partial [Pseudomonas sp. EA_65y_Pfl1_P113]|uniref:hypothetical protein n=1 Tax=Pseudomonas sp. EA_65y_Pfl1_P113 TaxID=3088692 RepID=UPI0030D9EA00